MTFKRTVFGKFVNEGLDYTEKVKKQRKKGFRGPKKMKITYTNPFHIYNFIFNYNKDHTRVRTHLTRKKHSLSIN
ncbi:MAG: hypothetical protein FWH54_02190 [Methanobrevibacter sp.]|nr:hypothetical protein [Methanobrevibacter sp.]